ncbi:hypothetical protein ACFSDD_04815 [Salipiger marinus]|uniref:hypothetical protein n=1 Tax=Salipiger marinus TaxID=555512 RepID=UPI001E30B42C|nr:hypothetical protein [Salipiger manganoxidans]MCD1620433.1 hypothetical protein [Salipiger manganoxidans]MEB3416945.1 hypothetical protein [Salipiger manganoxidans]
MHSAIRGALSSTQRQRGGDRSQSPGTFMALGFARGTGGDGGGQLAWGASRAGS